MQYLRNSLEIKIMETKNNFYASRKKKNPPDPHFYSYPKGFILNHETAREIFTLSELNEELRWNVTVGKPKKGDIAGEVGHKSGRISINGTRWRKDDVISIYLTGNPINRTIKCKDMDTYEKEWMKEIKVPKFHDWSYEWQKDKRRRKAGEYSRIKYAAMTEDERRKTWRERDQRRDKIAKREYTAKWKSRNPEKVKEYARRHNTNPKHKPKRNLRDRFKELMGTTRKGGSMSFSRTIGCTTKQLASYLEAQFTKRMTWDNYGTYWHVDHILPVSSFNHLDPNQVRLCWHWTNLRPLTAKKNLEKRDKIKEPQMSLPLPY